MSRQGNLPARLLAAAVVLGLTAALSGCSFPPYQEDLSLGVITASKMGEPLAYVGPLYGWIEELLEKDTVFLPSKADLHAWTGAGDPIEGFVVAAGDYSARLITVRYNATDERYFMSNDIFQPVVNDDENAFVFLAETIEGGDLLSITYFDPESPQPRRFILLAASLAGVADLELNAEIGTALGLASPLVIGAGFYPAAATASDRFHALVVDSAGRFTEAEAGTDSLTGLTPPVPIRTSVTIAGLPSGLEQGFYNRDPASGYSYLSTYDAVQKKLRSFRWGSDLAAAELADLKFPIRRVLSTGRLFARGDTMGYVYDSDGNEINRFPMGGLHLACELIDAAGDDWLYFTLPAFGREPETEENRDRDKEYVIFVVYRIRTSAIEAL